MKKFLVVLLQLAVGTAVAQNFALTLNGSNQFVSIGAPIASASSYTKEAWVYATLASGNNNIISSNSSPFWINGGILLAGQAGNFSAVSDVSGFTLNQWVHVAVTYDAPSTTMKLYRNGTLVATNTSVPAYTNENVFIGSHQGSGSFFQGNIDEVRIWNTARTQAQLKATMYKGPSVTDVNLIAYYKCNDGSGATLTDAKASFNGSIQNAAGFIASPVQESASAIGFDGADDVVSIPNNGSLNISAAITLEAWVYPTKNSGIQNVISKSSMSSNNGYIFPRTNDGWTTFCVYLNIGGWKVVTSSFPSLNSWHHLAATYDGATIRIYLDGVEVNSMAQTGAISTNSNALALGNQPGFSEFFGGYADEFRIWNVARTQSEIQSNMNKQLDPTTQTGLVSYYKVNQGVIGGTNTGLVTLVDQASSNNGTLANFAWSGSVSNFVAQSNLITLPVQWQNFTAIKQNENALLQWSTASEQNTKEFIIQRSSNATIWQELKKLPAAGNSNALMNYSYEDRQPLAGSNYYRILQTDIDGRFSYSDVKLVQFTDAVQKVFIVQANPVINKIIQLQVNQPALITVYTLAGKLIKQQQAGAGPTTVDMSKFSAGIYLVKAGGQTEKLVIK